MNTRQSKFFLFLSGLFFFGLAIGCSGHLKPGVSLVTDALLTNEDEQMLWQKSEQEQRAFESNGFIYPDRAVEGYLNQVVAKLQPQSLPADLTIRVKIIKNAYLNAFAYPNGMIFIHTGLLARMENEAQLAMVLAHEMTHIIHRHALLAFRKYKQQPAVLRAFQHTLLNTRGLQEMARFMGITGALVNIGGYSRELELEADRVGIELMSRAGYNPKRGLALFEQMISEIEQEGLEEPFLFGSHPKFRQRANHLKNLPDSIHSNIGPEIFMNERFLAKLDQLFLDNARMDIRIGRFESARKGIEKYLRVKPDDTQGYFLLGEIYRQRSRDGDIQEALKNYNRAILLDPNFAAPYKAIGLIHYKKGHHTLAKKFFESCLQLAPDSPDQAYIKRYLMQCALSKEG